MNAVAYEPDRSLGGKLRRRLARMYARRPATQAPPRGMVSFTFDDAPVSAARKGAAVLEARGLTGTFFIASGLAGQDSHLGQFTSAEDVARLAAAGHEIGCHTRSHLDCAGASLAVMDAEFDANAEVLGSRPTVFAYPYGEVGFAAKRAVSHRFQIGRTVQAGLVTRGGDLAQAPAVGIEGADGEAIARRWLDRAAAECAWVILYTHDVRPDASGWGCTPEALARVVDHALALGLEPVTVEDGARRLRPSA